LCLTPLSYILLAYNHSKDFEGISWYLYQYAIDLRALTLNTELKTKAEKPVAKEAAKANFILW